MERTGILIVGAGVAGLTAAVTAARAGASVLVIDKIGVGGQIATVDRIENFGQDGDPVSGFDIGLDLQEQAEDAGAMFRLGEVTSITVTDDAVTASCDGEDIVADALIYCAGSTRRSMSLDGEERLRGRGVSTCASCDGPLMRGKSAIILGGGDSAFDEALVLSEYASDLRLVYRGDTPKAKAATVERVRALPNVSEISNATVVALRGGDGLDSVDVKSLSDDRVTTLETHGLFVYAGLEPATELVRGIVDFDTDGRIVVDEKMQTRHPRIFAAGDLRGGSASHLISVAADGSRAAQSALGLSVQAETI